MGTPEDARTLGVGTGSTVMLVERGYFAGEPVVEVAGIIVPAESTKPVCNGPVGDS
ncbi:hypothetical protein [Nonomuraea guangzhouensis]|uniref:UTRA domain-containing protein n=1 Tax=Nonomuraea guangzhouensis TaxID=1291555 RepID=A0ABW4GAF8_9ACTN|nr:hypothetical protein [Nonomuraea guangzhouensis]